MAVCTDIRPEPAYMNKKPKLEEYTQNPSLMVKRLSEHATIPTRGSSHAAGYDLYRYNMYPIILLFKREAPESYILQHQLAMSSPQI